MRWAVIPNFGLGINLVSEFIKEARQFYPYITIIDQHTHKMANAPMGTVIKGGVEGLQMRPPKAQCKFIEPIVKAIVNLVDEGNFNPTDIDQLAIPVRLGKVVEILFKTPILRLTNFFMWDQRLKKNDAYEKRFDRPYSSLSNEKPTI